MADWVGQTQPDNVIPTINTPKDWIGKTQSDEMGMNDVAYSGPDYWSVFSARYLQSFAEQGVATLTRRAEAMYAEGKTLSEIGTSIEDYYSDYDNQLLRGDTEFAQKYQESLDQTNPIIGKEAWNNGEVRYKGKPMSDLGLQFKEGHRQGYWDVIAENKSAELERKKIIEASKISGLAAASLYVADFAGAASDPLNLLSAAIPFATGASIGTRIGIGIAEGVLTSLPFEGIIYTGRKEQQLDYELSDVAMSVGFAGLLSVGGHLLSGLINDKLARSVVAKQFENDLKANTAPMFDSPKVKENLEAMGKRMYEEVQTNTLRKDVYDVLKSKNMVNAEGQIKILDDIMFSSMNRGLIKNADEFYKAVKAIDVEVLDKHLKDLMTAFAYPPIPTQALKQMKETIQELFRIGAPGVDISKDDIKNIIVNIYKRAKDDMVVSKPLKDVLDSWVSVMDNTKVDAEKWVKGEPLAGAAATTRDIKAIDEVNNRMNKQLNETPEQLQQRLQAEHDLLQSKFQALVEKKIVPETKLKELNDRLVQANIDYKEKVELINQTVLCFVQGAL